MPSRICDFSHGRRNWDRVFVMCLEEKEYVVTNTDKDSSLDTPYVLDVSLNRHSAEPLYRQIFAPIAQLIEAELLPNQLLEDEISMARLNISRPTARALQGSWMRDCLCVGAAWGPASHRPMCIDSWL